MIKFSDNTAWIIISDLHLAGQPKENRFSYDGEIMYVANFLRDLISKYKSLGMDVYLIFLGDIFDRSYRKPEKVGVDISLLDALLLETKSAYVVVGNHEINYYVNNPFWTMINSVDSERLSRLVAKNIQPLGFVNKFKVLDSLEVGDCVFHFNHFSCPDSPPVIGKKNFAFYHKAIYAHEIAEHAKINGVTTDFYYVKPSASMNVLKQYDVCFMAHLHTLFGTWNLDGTEVTYLPSLGRPHKDEVSDNFLCRTVPVITFENNQFKEVIKHSFNLLSSAESVIPEIATAERAIYEVNKTVAESRKYVGSTDDPLTNIASYFVDNSYMLGIIQKLVRGDSLSLSRSIVDQYMDIRERRLKL